LVEEDVLLNWKKKLFETKKADEGVKLQKKMFRRVTRGAETGEGFSMWGPRWVRGKG